MAPIAHPSPNFGPRPGGAGVEYIILHYTAMESAEAALERLCATEFEVSAHYLIAADGRLFQMVDEADRAWHAGRSAWGACRDLNSHSIGIELDNDGFTPYAPPLLDRLEPLLRDLLERYALPPEAVLAHSDVSPGRKTDPGALFPWDRLAKKGLARAKPQTFPRAPVEAFWPAAQALGYHVSDTSRPHVLDAFRLRYLPGADRTAPLGPEDAAMACQLCVEAGLSVMSNIDPGPARS